MSNNLEFLIVTRNLDFKGLRLEFKNQLYSNFNIIIRQPKGLPTDLWDFARVYNACKSMKKSERQMIFHGVLINLSIKMYFMVCILLLLGEIDEDDLNYIHFREGALKRNQPSEGNLRKSLNDLKTMIQENIKATCTQNQNYFNNNSENKFDKNIYNKSFKKFAYSDNSIRKTIRTSYRKANLPDFLKRISKKKT